MPTSFQMPQSSASTLVVRGRDASGERVEEHVRGDVLDLAHRGRDGPGAGEHDEHVEVVVGRHLLEHERAGHLGRQHVLDLLALGDHQPVVDHTGGVHHTVHPAEAAAHLGRDLADAHPTSVTSPAITSTSPPAASIERTAAIRWLSA